MSLFGKASTLAKSIPGLRKLKVIGRGLGVLGILLDIGMGVAQSITSLSPMTFFEAFGFNLVLVSQGLSQNVSALQSGATGLMYWQNTLGIYSKIWFLIFVTGIIASQLQKTFLGNQVPPRAWMFLVFVMFITPVQMLGAVMVDVQQDGAFVEGEVSELGVWNGLSDVALNSDLWIDPALKLADNFGHLKDFSGNTSHNLSGIPDTGVKDNGTGVDVVT